MLSTFSYFYPLSNQIDHDASLFTLTTQFEKEIGEKFPQKNKKKWQNCWEKEVIGFIIK